MALVAHTLQGRPLARVVNTHLHSDHCGGNAALAARYGCTITIPAGEADKVARWDEDALTYKPTGQSCPPFTHTDVMHAGDEIVLGALPWRVMASPGHDTESMVLYQPEAQILISADALWENGFGVVFPELEGESGFGDVRATLDLIGALPVRWVIPGHGAPFRDAGAALERAHRKLDAFIADPPRHARHAAKVLIKYHLMECHRMSVEALVQWLSDTKYFAVIHRLYFASIPLKEWTATLLEELVASKALARSGGVIENA
jgi:glyoxylase-like metal-dependent hydrolase (beta-lactamase superfamily II)